MRRISPTESQRRREFLAIVRKRRWPDADKRKMSIDVFSERWTPEPNSGCWLWIKALTKAGYGSVSFNQKVDYAHRVSWVLYRGEPPAGMFVLHRCDTPACVNPDHLFLGTAADNFRDCRDKGRLLPGQWKFNIKRTKQ